MGQRFTSSGVQKEKTGEGADPMLLQLGGGEGRDRQ